MPLTEVCLPLIDEPGPCICPLALGTAPALYGNPDMQCFADIRDFRELEP